MKYPIYIGYFILKEDIMKKKIISLIFIVLTLALCLVGCQKEEQIYKITYMLDEETVYRVDTGTIIHTKPYPAKQGFHFVNWYSKPDFSSKPLIYPLNLQSDITVYAKFEEGIFEYEKNTDNTTCTITNLYKCPLDKDIVFPAQIDGLNVTDINIKSSLKNVNYIKSISFSSDIHITNLSIILDNIKKIDLSNLNSLNNINILGCNKLNELILPKVEVIPSNFLSVVNLDTLTIPNTVKTISKNAISNSNIKNIVFENNSNITTIKNKAFNSLLNLTKIDIPTSIQTIENEAFYNCNMLEKITLNNDNLINLGNNNSKISNSENTVVFIKENLLNEYKNKYKNIKFEAILIK